MTKRGDIIDISFILLAVIFCALVIFLAPQTRSYTGSGTGPFNCSTNCSDCNAAIGNASAGAVVYLTSSLGGNNATCINFGTQSNIIFDCQNFSNYISGNGSGNINNYYGINLNNAGNNAVANCNISSFNDGIYSTFSSGNILSNVFLKSNYYGIHLENSNANNLTNITSRDNTNWGIYFHACSNNILTNITAFRNYDGLYIHSSNNSLLTNITAYNNTNNGIYLDRSKNNTVSGAITNNNSNYGIYLDHSLLGSVSGLTSNNSYGIYLSISNTTLTNITSLNNTVGIKLANSDNNSLISISLNDGLQLATSKNNILTNITTRYSSADGILLSTSSNGNSLINITSSINTHDGIELLLSNNNSLININSFNNTNDGVSFLTSNNNSLSNLISNSNLNGIDVTGNNTLISNATANYNRQYGVYLATSVGNNLSNLSLNNNSIGLYLYYSNNNSVINATTINNSLDGLYVQNSNYSSFTDFIINSNSRDGIRLFFSQNNILTNMNTNNNVKSGIQIMGNSTNNTIKNSFIQFNNVSGLLINFTSSFPQYNLFYNNYFNNSVQYSNISASLANFFNITKTLASGTNIVGGNYLGGNYWAALNASGFSQTCSASTDGICDTSYNLDGVNFDYLPLTCIEDWTSIPCSGWSTCIAGTQTRTCTDANYCQTYKYRPNLTQSCIVGGEIQKSAEATETKNIEEISPNQPSSININTQDIELRNLTISAKTKIVNSSLTVAKKDVIPPFGTLYQAFSVTTNSIKNADLNNVTMEFRVNKTWLIQNNRSYNNVILYRIPNATASWQALMTLSIREDPFYYYFIALSPGFSTFVILISAPGEIECTQLQTRCFNKEIQSCSENNTWITEKKCIFECEEGKCTLNEIAGIPISFAVYGMAIAIAAAVIIAVIARIRKARKKPV